MIDPYRKIREALGLANKYTDEQVAEAKKYADEKFASVPAPAKIEPIDVDAIAKEVYDLLPKPKKLKRKKKGQAPVMTPEDVMALIVGSLEEANKEYVKTGDTIVIQEAPQKIIERIREVTKVEGRDVDYDSIYKELDRRMMEWRQTLNFGGGSYDSLSMLRDVNLNGVPQDKKGNYLLGQTGGEAAEAFEKVSKNLKSYPYTLNYTGEDLTSLVYDLGSGQSITKTLAYSDGNLISITLSGDTPAGINLVKTLSYTDENLTSVTYA
jgi:hypothetical protein